MSKGWEEGPSPPKAPTLPPAHVLPGPLAPDRTEPWAPRVTGLTPPRGSAARPGRNRCGQARGALRTPRPRGREADVHSRAAEPGSGGGVRWRGRPGPVLTRGQLLSAPQGGHSVDRLQGTSDCKFTPCLVQRVWARPPVRFSRTAAQGRRHGVSEQSSQPAPRITPQPGESCGVSERPSTAHRRQGQPCRAPLDTISSPALGDRATDPGTSGTSPFSGENLSSGPWPRAQRPPISSLLPTFVSLVVP
ncbi:uncharacterized protein LOC118887392 [Balaenoptera musculus]|uniref:Uncharacterized protein LOC118887392 n=1 Tax=Balaenoptera musculus TaxID=9771 RepID=A0A8B8WAB0_BALMU|nr:uncharacterized protein LOC118887392 [Balaenoptera musculus]